MDGLSDGSFANTAFVFADDLTAPVDQDHLEVLCDGNPICCQPLVDIMGTCAGDLVEISKDSEIRSSSCN